MKLNEDQKALLKEFLSYMAIFYIPSSTPAYIMLREGLGWEMIPAYIIGNTVAGIFSFIITKIIWNKIRGNK